MKSQRGVSFWYILLGILVVIVIGYWLFANSFIKSVLEEKMSQAYGAEVNIGKVSHTLIPVTASLYDIQLTDPATPAQNKIQIGQASADVEVLPLLSDQLVVQKLNVLEVKFAQPRQSPGQVFRQPDKSIDLTQIKTKAKEAVPTVDELLARSELKSTLAAQQAEQAYQQYSDSLTQTYQSLPDKDRVTYYKKEIEKLKKADYASPQALAKARQELDKLKQQIKQDQQRIAVFTKQAQNAQKALKASVSELKKAPAQDFDLLKSAISGDQAAMERVTKMVFGEKAEQMTAYLTSATQLILPLLQGQQEDQQTQPAISSVLVKEAYISVEFLQQKLMSEWQNITNTHPLIGEPTRYSIFADGNSVKQFESTGQFWLDEDGVDAEQQWTLEGINLADIRFLQSDKLSALLESAILASTGRFKVDNNAVSGNSSVTLSDLALQAKGQNQFTTSIAKVLQQLEQLNLDLSFSGQVNNPDFSISSDLDNQFAELAWSELSDSQKDKLEELKQKLAANVSDSQQQASNALKDINKMLAAAQGDKEDLQQLMQAQLSDVVDKQKNKLLDKLKDKLGQNG